LAANDGVRAHARVESRDDVPSDPCGARGSDRRVIRPDECKALEPA
jgi:hypothetical protein